MKRHQVGWLWEDLGTCGSLDTIWHGRTGRWVPYVRTSSQRPTAFRRRPSKFHGWLLYVVVDPDRVEQKISFVTASIQKTSLFVKVNIDYIILNFALQFLKRRQIHLEGSMSSTQATTARPSTFNNGFKIVPVLIGSCRICCRGNSEGPFKILHGKDRRARPWGS